jgi:hypothetical protein
MTMEHESSTDSDVLAPFRPVETLPNELIDHLSHLSEEDTPGDTRNIKLGVREPRPLRPPLFRFIAGGSLLHNLTPVCGESCRRVMIARECFPSSTWKISVNS